MTAATLFDRTPPQDTAAEQCVLGAMLLSKDAIADVVEAVGAVDFYDQSHITIFKTIVDMFTTSRPADPITVANELLDSGDLERVGGVPYLHTLVATVPTAANAAYYAGIVAEKATFRRVIETGTRIVQYGYNPGTNDGDDVVNLAQAATYQLTDRRRSNGDAELIELLMQPTLDEIEAISAMAGQMRGIPTGFTDLDRLLNGLQGGQLIVWAGRPGIGKSVGSTDVARNAAIKHNLPTVMFNLEMSKTELMMRILSAESRVPLNVIRSGQLSDDDWTKLARRMGEISAAPLMIDDTANLTLAEIRAKSRRLKEQHGLKLIVVDYLGLLTPTTRKDGQRNNEVAELSRGLKLLAKELDIPVIAVHQLNRGPEQRTEKRPQLSDLRDSGAVEQDADIVIFVHRDDYYDKESPRSGEADFIVAKHRNGPTDTITVAAQLHFSRFVDMAFT